MIPISHPVHAVRLMLRRKELTAREVALKAGFHPLQLRLAGFPGRTVPAMRLNGREVQGSLAIARALEEAAPTPPLFPAEPEARQAVEGAEGWGERELQPMARRLFRWCLVRDGGLRRGVASLNRLPAPGLAATVMRPVAGHFAREAGASDGQVRADLAALPAAFDRLDGWLEDGLLGGDLTAADCQIAPTVRLLLQFEQLAAAFGGRPSAGWARELLPDYEGQVPAAFPAEWILA